MSTSGARAFAGLAALSLLLSGCAAVAVTPDSNPGATTPIPATTTSPGPTSSISPADTEDPLPLDAVFRITADLVSPAGVEILVTETLHAPTTDSADQDHAAIVAAECYDTTADADATYLHVDTSSTVLNGGALDKEDLVLLDVGWSLTQAWTGDAHSYQAYCDGPYLRVPGSAQGVFSVVGSDSPDRITKPGIPQQRVGWAMTEYGVSAVHLPESDDTVAFTVKKCTLELGPEAGLSTLISAWDPAHPNPGECTWGNQQP